MTNPTMSFCAYIARCVPNCWQAAKNGMPSRTTMRKNTCFVRYVQFAARIVFWLSLNRNRAPPGGEPFLRPTRFVRTTRVTVGIGSSNGCQTRPGVSCT